MKKKIMKTLITPSGIPYLGEEATSYKVDGRVRYDNPDKVYELACQLDCDKLAEEKLYVLCLNSKANVTGLFEASMGNINGNICDPRSIFQKALLLGAVSIILWHNHPSGDSTPSMDDEKTTFRLVEAGKIIGIKVLDHIVVGRNEFTSLHAMGVI